MVDVIAIVWYFSCSILALLAHCSCRLVMAIASPASRSSPLPWKRTPEQQSDSTGSKRSKENHVFADKYALDFLAPGTVECPTEDSVGRSTLKVRRRPTMLVIPDTATVVLSKTATVEADFGGRDLEVEGDGYCMASRMGSKMVMEDGYEAITNINGDAKQAYFGVFDGHGGRAAVDFVCRNLGKNIIDTLSQNQEAEELAIRTGYLTTDQDFLSLNLGSGVCASTVLLKDGYLHAANAGDCRIVLSRNGEAQALTSDHRAARDDERQRIEDTGGHVKCHNGVWRVEKSLSISRAIGDLHLKEWIISEPEITSVHLTSDCEFALMASDGLWDKVSDQEAVDVILKGSNPMQSCKDLIEISSSRGSRDDITVMLIHLQRFLRKSLIK